MAELEAIVALLVSRRGCVKFPELPLKLSLMRPERITLVAWSRFLTIIITKVLKEFSLLAGVDNYLT